MNIGAVLFSVPEHKRSLRSPDDLLLSAHVDLDSENPAEAAQAVACLLIYSKTAGRWVGLEQQEVINEIRRVHLSGAAAQMFQTASSQSVKKQEEEENHLKEVFWYCFCSVVSLSVYAWIFKWPKRPTPDDTSHHYPLSTVLAMHDDPEDVVRVLYHMIQLGLIEVVVHQDENQDTFRVLYPTIRLINLVCTPRGLFLT